MWKSCNFYEQPSLNLTDEISPTLKADSNNELSRWIKITTEIKVSEMFAATSCLHDNIKVQRANL